MEVDQEKLEEVALVLLSLTLHEHVGATRAWKSLDWDLLDALHRRGWISDPASKAKSVVVTAEGQAAARDLLERHFGAAGSRSRVAGGWSPAGSQETRAEAEPARSRDLVVGTWEITRMELWEKRMLDLEQRAHLAFDPDGMGTFGFVAVRGRIDYRVVTRDRRPTVEFSWEGSDAGSRRSGRGWAVLDGDTMRGRLFIHDGDDSAFEASRVS
jgi:hypothetical protein